MRCVAGLWAVVRAPLLLAAVAIVTLLAAAPFAVFVNTRVQASLAARPQVSLPSTEIDPEWWMEFRAHADGLAATFTPTIIGFAAPLDNLSSVLDGTRRPLALAVPVALAGLLWVFLWGGLLDRFSRPGRTRVRAFVSAGLAHAPRLLVIAVAAATRQPDPLFHGPCGAVWYRDEWLAARAGSERDAFFWRLGLYAIFGALLVTVSVIADYARVHAVVAGVRSAPAAIAASMRFVRRHAATVFTLYLMTGTLFVALLIVYGATETIGRSRVGGWRAVAVGQAYILARLAIRLIFGASEVRLFQALRPRTPADSAGSLRASLTG